ncbi:DUF2975 domain-containing protein [Allopontixanthobacter sp.]|uniref:DUF2975 domain-containing protein n=1 Tax=Allopontixanthobacter sp. TaxID=2906452 RepID=UPI002AB8C393|nr:DUF2975 domain-containing protein [Allopontixanthobacter sp.]MDZ4308672.1 DUF2975 domain-containing protein [Allopontixanthobacter sp.]
MINAAKDPLLTIARIVLMFFIVVLGIAGAALVIALPVMLFNQSALLAELAADGKDVVPGLVPAAAFVLAGAAGLMALGVYFLLLLRRIVNSVGEGDPFIPDNATRLSRMGWVAIIGQAAAIPIGIAVIWIAGIAADSGEHVHADFGFSGGGVLLVLILFILARVFRKGTEMREELEGTV